MRTRFWRRPKYFDNWICRRLIGGVSQKRAEVEQELNRLANIAAMGTRSGLGGIKDACFHTPRPWEYETSLSRKIAWYICWIFDRLFRNIRKPTYVLPLKTDEYTKGRRIVFHSGVEIKECGEGEMSTFSQAYFERYPYHP